MEKAGEAYYALVMLTQAVVMLTTGSISLASLASFVMLIWRSLVEASRLRC
jgi:hypothetical protein